MESSVPCTLTGVFHELPRAEGPNGHIGLIHPPGSIGMPELAANPLIQNGGIALDPTPDRESRQLSEYRKYQRTQRTMVTSSKCRPRNSAGRFWLTVSPYQIDHQRLQHIPYPIHRGRDTGFEEVASLSPSARSSDAGSIAETGADIHSIHS